MLDETHIRVKEDASNWEEAVQKAGNVLIDAGSITQGYIDRMICSVKELGPYIVMMPKLALAHAAPCKEVLKNDIALITLKTPVKFGSVNDPVWVVLCLGCTDKTSHLDKLSQVAELLMKESTVDQIVEADSVDRVIEVLFHSSKTSCERKAECDGDN